MKINAEAFLENFNKYNLENKAILISGNEPGLIIKIQNIILLNLQKNGNYHKDVLDFKNIKKNDFDEQFRSQSLFNDFKILQIINSTDSFVDYLQDLVIDNCSILITSVDIKTRSKIRNYFDRHKAFLSIVCYRLSKEFKKRMVDGFIRKNDLNLTKDAYWYFFEKCGDEYQFIENELEKILVFNKKRITIDEIRRLLSDSRGFELDDLFFQCAIGNKNSIIVNSQNTIRSSSDAYAFLQIVKNFSKILIATSENKERESLSSLVKNYLPKYLFRQTKNFETVIKKTNVQKLIAINKLLQKTELFLRKNDSNYLIIIQRFMLNFSKILK